MGDICKIGVVGFGVMGSGIAETCARADLDVLISVSTSTSRDRGIKRLMQSLDRSVRKGSISEAEKDAALRRMSFTTNLDDLSDRHIIIESIREDEHAKLLVFEQLAKIVDDSDTILASNTSSIPIVKLARTTRRPGQVVGTHFFNPAPTLPLVELVESILTDNEVTTRVETFLAKELGKQVIRARDRAGFVVNALLIPYLLSAIRMVESGVASAQDVDRAMMLGCAHPTGPLALADLIGLDTVVAIAESLHDEFKQQQYSTPPILSRMVDAGILGRKTGVGFHDYGDTTKL